MHELSVPTTPVTVELRCADGRRFAGTIYLPEQSPHGRRAMGVEEWANAAPSFFPFRGGSTDIRTVFNKHEIVAFTVPAANERDADEELVGALSYSVVIETASQQYAGEILVDTPPSQRRVVDWLNAPDEFITLRDGERHHVIRKAFITRVLEMRGDHAGRLS